MDRDRRVRHDLGDAAVHLVDHLLRRVELGVVAALVDAARHRADDEGNRGVRRAQRRSARIGVDARAQVGGEQRDVLRVELGAGEVRVRLALVPENAAEDPARPGERGVGAYQRAVEEQRVAEHRARRRTRVPLPRRVVLAFAERAARPCRGYQDDVAHGVAERALGEREPETDVLGALARTAVGDRRARYVQRILGDDDRRGGDVDLRGAEGGGAREHLGAVVRRDVELQHARVGLVGSAGLRPSGALAAGADHVALSEQQVDVRRVHRLDAHVELGVRPRASVARRHAEAPLTGSDGAIGDRQTQRRGGLEPRALEPRVGDAAAELGDVGVAQALDAEGDRGVVVRVALELDGYGQPARVALDEGELRRVHAHREVGGVPGVRVRLGAAGEQRQRRTEKRGTGHAASGRCGGVARRHGRLRVVRDVRGRGHGGDAACHVATDASVTRHTICRRFRAGRGRADYRSPTSRRKLRARRRRSDGPQRRSRTSRRRS